jgi:hypothetical protein
MAVACGVDESMGVAILTAPYPRGAPVRYPLGSSQPAWFRLAPGSMICHRVRSVLRLAQGRDQPTSGASAVRLRDVIRPPRFELGSTRRACNDRPSYATAVGTCNAPGSARVLGLAARDVSGSYADVSEWDRNDLNTRGQPFGAATYS